MPLQTKTETATLVTSRFTASRLSNQRPRSFGEAMWSPNWKHGHTGKGWASPTWYSWIGMINRCTHEYADVWKYYGGRGIKVCDRWREFRNFLSDMGERPTEMTLERIDNNGNYEPGNCRWASRAEQNRNIRRNRMVSYKGETKCITDWNSECGFPPGVLFKRLRCMKWPIERAMTEPVHPKGSHNA